MTPEQFAYWLQGFAEIRHDDKGLSFEQWQTIRDHLQEVFRKQTPDRTPNRAGSITTLQQDLGKQTVPYYPHSSNPQWNGNHPFPNQLGGGYFGQPTAIC